MEILLSKRALKTIRLSVADAIEEGDTETLREDILDAFSEEQVEEIERRIDTDFFDFIGDALEEWSGEDVDELFELVESQLADIGIELKFEGVAVEEVEGEEGAADDVDVDADDDLDLDDEDGDEELEEDKDKDED